MEQKNIYYSVSFEESKKNLDSISSTFCAAKWLQVSLHLTNGKTHSCYHPPTHSIDIDQLESNPSALHNTSQKFQERKMMLEGQRPSGCNYCWKIEDAGHVSDRYYRSSEHWAKDKIIPISQLPYDHNVDPSYIEVNFNQTCNFKCAYCSPHLSSSWQEEIEEHGPYIFPDKEHNNIDRLKKLGLMPIEGSVKNNPYVTAFWKWWPNIYSSLRVFRMTGGEPMLDANTFKVLDYVASNPNKNLELNVTSNLCPPRQDIFDRFLEKIKALDSVEFSTECYVPDPKNGKPWQEWPHYIIGCEAKEYHNSNLPSIERHQIPQTFPEIGHALEDGSFTYLYKYHDVACKHFILYVSLDSIGSQAEYLRNGLIFDVLKSNVEKFLSNTKNTSISFINTFNILSISKFKNYLEYILDLRQKWSAGMGFQRVWFDIPMLHSPAWLSCYNASDEQISMLEDVYKWMQEHTDIVKFNQTFQGFKPFELEKLQRNINVIKENKFTKEQQIKNNQDFKIFFEEHDRRRNTNFVKTFPEMAEWYRNIK